MKLSDWAKKQGISYKTAWRHFSEGKIKGVYQLESGTIIVPNGNDTRKDKYAVYARVSSSENKAKLERQAARLVTFCNANGWGVSKVVKEVGSGLNDNRKKLMRIIEDRSLTKIVVEHKDRFSRFGLNYINALLEMDGREIIIVNGVENDEDDLMQDFVSIITFFTARLYGLRRSKRKTEKIIKELTEE